MRLFLRGFGVVLGLGIAAFSGACGGGDEGTSSSGGGPAGVPLSQLSAKYSDVFCGAIEQCFGPLSEIFNGADDCVAETQKSLDNDFIQRLNGYIAAGTVVYHADKVQACLDAIGTSGCALVNGDTPDVCDEAVEGKVATGAMCNDGVECVGSDFCEFVNATCPGTCTARKAENADCSSNGDCMSGLACQFDSKQGKQICRTPAKVGEACKGSNAADCGAGSVCVGESPMTSGVCKAPSDVVVQGSGEVCNPQDELLCQEGFSCAVDNLMQKTFKCVPNSASGGICVAGVPDPCPEGEYCNFDPMSADGICNKLPTDGQACVELDLMVGPNCAAGHICDGTKTCRLKQVIGGTCTEDDVCYSRTCDAGKCVVPPACTQN